MDLGLPKEDGTCDGTLKACLVLLRREPTVGLGLPQEAKKGAIACAIAPFLTPAEDGT